MADERWTPLREDLSAADDRSDVRVRFNVGPTGAATSCSWNVDDLEILGTPDVAPLGRVVLDRGEVQPPHTLTITVADANAGGEDGALEVSVVLPGVDEPLSVSLPRLRAGVYAARMPLVFAADGGQPGELGVAAEGTLQVIYDDQDDGTGAAGQREATATVTLPSEAEALRVTVAGDQTAGEAFELRIVVVDRYDRPAEVPEGATLELSDSTGMLSVGDVSPPNDGVFTAEAVLTKAAEAVIVEAQAGPLSGRSEPFAVTAAAPAELVFEPLGPQAAGVPFSVSLAARDAFGNATRLEGALELSDLTGSLELGAEASAALVEGAWTGEVVIKEARSDDVLQASVGGVQGTSQAFDVSGGSIGGSGGCSCSTTAGSEAGGSLTLGVLLLGALWATRRRR